MKNNNNLFGFLLGRQTLRHSYLSLYLLSLKNRHRSKKKTDRLCHKSEGKLIFSSDKDIFTEMLVNKANCLSPSY